MTDLPKISIVTPSFNQAEFLEETILSVLNQGYPNLEYFIIDGGSTDGSVEIIKKYESQISGWSSEKDSGHADALNKGFSQTTGEIMAWINSDDKYPLGSFQIVGEIFAKFPHIEWVSGIHSIWNDKGVRIHTEKIKKNIYDFLLGNYAWIQQESVFWKRSLWGKSGSQINENYRLMVDGELWTRFFLHAELYTVDAVLGGFRKHGTNRSTDNREDCLKEMEAAIGAMREKCDQETLAITEQLETLREESKSRFLRWFPFLKKDKSLTSALLEKAGYPSIVCDNGVCDNGVCNNGVCNNGSGDCCGDSSEKSCNDDKNWQETKTPFSLE